MAIFSPNSNIVVTSCRDRRIRIWDVLTNQLLSDHIYTDTTIEAMSIDSSGTSLLLHDKAGRIFLWEIISDCTNKSLVNTCITIAEANIKRKLTEFGYEMPADNSKAISDLIRSEKTLDNESRLLVSWFYDKTLNRPVSPRVNGTVATQKVVIND